MSKFDPFKVLAGLIAFGFLGMMVLIGLAAIVKANHGMPSLFQ